MCGIGLVLTSPSVPCPTCISRPSPSLSPLPSYSHQSPDCNDGSHANNPIVSTKFDLELERRLCQRGPDHFQRLIRRVAVGSQGDHAPNNWTIALHSAVLHLRGDQVVPQPVQDSDSNVLCWNGEVFAMNKEVSNEEQDDDILMQGSDTLLLSHKLQLAGDKFGEMTIGGDDPVVQVLRRVQGPFAVAWWHEKTKRVYFAHDRFGRRSLLYRRWGEDESEDMIAGLAGRDGAHMKSVTFLEKDLMRFVLSSVAISDEDISGYQELPASGIYVLDLRAHQFQTNSEMSYRMEFYPYAPLNPKASLVPNQPSTLYVSDQFGNKLPRPVLTSEANQPGDNSQQDASTLETSACALLIALSNAVGVRVRSIPRRSKSDGLSAAARVAVLFSGGLDSVVIAALTHFHVPHDEPIELLTVCFDENSNFASPDRRAAELSHMELCGLFPERWWSLVKVNVPKPELASTQQEVQTLMSPCYTHMDFNIGAAFWFLSRGCGELKTSAQVPENSSLEDLNAFLKPQRADLRELETEVAALSLFDNQTATGNAILCPVHRCGRKRKHGCVIGVCKSCCFKIQRAVKKIILYENGNETGSANSLVAQGCREMLIAMGMQSETHLDLLLELLKSTHQDEKSAVELSCRVHRTKHEQASATVPTSVLPVNKMHLTSCAYQTSVRVVLVGIGADEQLAGYGRHRTALLNGGEKALRDELQVDLGRIWKRNLGRDDRCIASHGREARFPYLDENVVSTIATFPISSLCDAELPRGVGDKRALRVVAKSLGLRSCAGLAKRAIQFGSRIAKVSNTGSNRQTQGVNKFTNVE